MMSQTLQCENDVEYIYFAIEVMFDILTVSAISYHIFMLIKASKTETNTNKAIAKLNFTFCAFCLFTAIIWITSNIMDCIHENANTNTIIARISAALYGAQYILLLFILFYRVCIVFEHSTFAISHRSKCVFYTAFLIQIILTIAIILLSPNREAGLTLMPFLGIFIIFVDSVFVQLKRGTLLV